MIANTTYGKKLIYDIQSREKTKGLKHHCRARSCGYNTEVNTPVDHPGP